MDDQKKETPLFKTKTKREPLRTTINQDAPNNDVENTNLINYGDLSSALPYTLV